LYGRGVCGERFFEGGIVVEGEGISDLLMKLNFGDLVEIQ
jgi:hypothetical protein